MNTENNLVLPQLDTDCLKRSFSDSELNCGTTYPQKFDKQPDLKQC